MHCEVRGYPLKFLGCLDEESVLHNGKFDIFLKALATELRCLLSVEPGNVRNVEIRSFLELC